MAKLSNLARVALLYTAGFLATTNAARVKPGQSIQAAINAASSGDKITIEAGVYNERLLITKSDLKIVGLPGAILKPPPVAQAANPCTGISGPNTDPANLPGPLSEAGICIISPTAVLEPYSDEHRRLQSLGAYLQGVKVQGLEIQYFSVGIATIGVNTPLITRNTLTESAAYGVLTIGSKSTHITKNTVKAAILRFIGICMDNENDVAVTSNRIIGYGIGLCVQSNDAEVRNNTVTSACYGIYVDPGVNGAEIVGNTIGASNFYCNPYFGGYAAGIAIYGAVDTEVKGNKISGTSDGNSSNIAAGVLIADQGGFIATGNDILQNVLSSNEQDIVVQSVGTGNVIKQNQCTTPASICANQ
jgi:nitrous oxidase accessory protein NosD